VRFTVRQQLDGAERRHVGIELVGHVLQRLALDALVGEHFLSRSKGDDLASVDASVR
jgi:hypothetical protein